jgi:putative long chain acyl-CoA synthase
LREVDLIPHAITQPLARIGTAAQNALEVARFGGLQTDEEPSPYEIVAEERVYRLRRYFPTSNGAEPGPPILLVPPLMLVAEVYDVAPATSAVAILRAAGIDPWVVDFGSPEREEGGLLRTLTDHVCAVSDAIDKVRDIVGRDVHLGGYSQGGMFCYQTAAYRRNDGIDSLVTFGSPVDVRGAIPFGIPEEIASRAGAVVAEVIGGQAVPAWAARTGFRLLDPVKSVRQRVDFILQLHNREALLPRERQRRFIMAEGWAAWPGPALAEFMRQFIVHNRMLTGGFVIEDRLVTLADIDRPILTFVGEVDEIANARAVRALSLAAPRADVYEVSLRAGHFGLVVGSAAARTTWPTVAAWAHWREGEGELPPEARHVEGPISAQDDAGSRTAARLGYGLPLAANVGLGVARSLAGTAARTVGAMRDFAEEAAHQLPRLTRLDSVEPRTRVSVGLLLDEAAERAARDVLFLFEDRAYTNIEVKRRIDNVVRGLISVGVRQGEHVGVLMETRPSVLTVVAALNRLGAVAVLMRPDGEIAREAELGQARRIVTDPEHAGMACDATSVQVLVLGGGGQPRDRGEAVVDKERIDPDLVRITAGYQPNPGRASDLAFIVFSGEGDRTRAKRITNGRWALSAFGTASSAALSAADTVYSVTPIHHPSGLLMTMGGAIAGGARLAVATHFDPSTFWAEVRRYGATVATYTWTLLHDIVEAPPNPGERHHPLRLFIGSGMPRGLWQRVEQRFAPARIVEFYASTEGDAVLVNVSGEKPGCKGRPLPGSTEVRLVGYDAETGRLAEGPDGFAREVPEGEAGMLVARVRPEVVGITGSALRGVFARNDAWLATNDLFRRDADGDYWFVDYVQALIRTAAGPVPTMPIQDALGDLEAVDLVVAYGVAVGPALEIAVAAVTVREGEQLSPAAIASALASLPPTQRPEIVHVIDEMPLTTWFRPRTGPLRAAGIPHARRGRAWYGDAARGSYKQLTKAARDRLAAGA